MDGERRKDVSILPPVIWWEAIQAGEQLEALGIDARSSTPPPNRWTEEAGSLNKDAW